MDVKSVRLDGGALCLDFVNTVGTRKASPIKDYLTSYQDLIDWLMRFDIVPTHQIRALSESAAADPVHAAQVLAESRRLRDLLYEVFSAIADSRAVTPGTQARLNAEVARCYADMYFEIGESSAGWTHPAHAGNLRLPLTLVVHSAVDVLTQVPFERIKECPACGWVFADRSKNRSRKWCSMEDCGSPVKSMRYYNRQRRKRTARAD